MATINITQVAPEIPDAASAPKQPGTPLQSEPVVMTSKRAKKKFDAGVRLYEELTGQQVTL